MNKTKNALRWLIPLTIVFVLFLAIWAHQLINERQLPAPGWSRTIHPEVAAKPVTPYVYKDGSKTHLLTVVDGGIARSVLDEKLHLLKKQVFHTKGDVQRVVWADASSILYKMDGSLFLHTSQTDKKIGNRAGDAQVEGGFLYYAQGNALHAYNLRSESDERKATFHEPIQAIAASGQHVIVITQDEQSTFHFYAAPSGSSQGKTHEFGRFSGFTHGNISVLETAQVDGKIGLFFIAHVLSQGEHFYNYYLEFSPKSLLVDKPMSINALPLTFTVKGTGENVETPMNTRFFIKDGKPHLLFSAEGLRTLRDTAINIYDASPEKTGKWTAERRSTSSEMSIIPFIIDQNTVGWLDYVSDEHYQIGLAATQPSIIKESLAYHTKDFSQSLSNAVLSLSRVFMFILLSIAYTIPTILAYGMITFFKIELIERDSPIVKWVLLAVFFVSQIFLLNHLEGAAFYRYAPSYLTFPFNHWVIPIVMGAITLLLVKWLASKEWSVISKTFYAMALFSIMEWFTFGPYFF